MRVVLVSMLLMLATPRAEACPHSTVCVSAETRIAVEQARGEISRPRSVLQLAIAKAERAERGEHAERNSNHRLAASLRTHVVPRAGAIEMPWIWQQLRRTVYAKMPRYERVDRRPENRFSFMVSPVVVESPQDTVPGVGIEGGF